MSAYGNAVQRAIIFCHTIVLTLSYCTLDVVIFLLVFHKMISL